ncbi:hypothetical protein SRRS_15980 [Sporomusa rhizae]|uniref:hypothetical protein n=1 Tax=Sporomusa rhizae TaxID=357999 RepID=UPI003529E38F
MDKSVSPYDFLKSRRPSQFSDSVKIQKAQLDRAFFDYYLESLTSRNEEKKFELFCKRLAELEICPNLISQTGPTGGGDSKVDSETYPVSDDTALTWYTGIGRQAASERWGFAFSAKKDWKSKIVADVKNILSTNRNYTTIFFMSNQYIPDKKRAATEDELTQKYIVQVKILDRSWLLDKIFNNHNEQVAAEIFGLSESFKTAINIGPLDYERKQKLDALEVEIKNLTADGVQNGSIVQMAIDAAELSRELELSLTETMGRFNRAIALASKYGTIIQQKECFYVLAWTLYYWYEEFDEFYNKYCDYEKLVVGGINVYDIERLTNLWMNLFIISKGDPNERNLGIHTEKLISEYERLINDKNRPNSALEARANYIFVKLLLGQDSNKLLEELASIITESHGVLDFSLDTISRIIMEIAPRMEESPGFDKLFETIVAMTNNRKQEIVSAKLLLTRGKQLVNKKPFSTVRYIGKALFSLYKEESKEDFLLALFLMGHACEKLDLLWASRGFYFNAFYISFIDYMKYGHLSPVLVASSTSMKMVELMLGRIPQLLAWHKMDDISCQLLSAVGYDTNKINKTENNLDLFDTILGMLFLRVPFDQLPRLSLLPDSLDKYQLYMASSALKYALGYIDKDIFAEHDNDEINQFMKDWYNQPAKDQIANVPIIGLNNIELLQSKILGCNIIIEADRKFPCIELSESILAALESFFATAPIDKIISVTPKVNIVVKYAASEKFKISYNKVDGQKYDIICSDFNKEEFYHAQNITKKFILGFIANLIAHILIFKDVKTQLEEMVENDNIFDRSLDFTGSVFLTEDLFGKDSMTLMDFASVDDTDYTLKRNTPLQLEDNTHSNDVDKVKFHKMTRQAPPPGVFDPENIRHKNMEVVSIINLSLWDKAKWKGIIFAMSPRHYEEPPILSPLFTDKDAGISIFKEWISMFGKVDEKNIITVGLIKGINKNNLSHYTVAFGANLDVLMPASSKYITTANRFHKMTPNNDINFKNFEDIILRRGKQYYLMPSYMNTKSNRPELAFDYAILKNDIEIRNAWEVDIESWLSLAITPDDDPFIPPNVTKAPITEVINLKNR